MNTLNAIITDVRTSGEISLVELRAGEESLKSTVIDTPDSAPYLKSGNRVRVLFKETEVILARPALETTEARDRLTRSISLQNRLRCLILEVDRGELLARITLERANDEQTIVSIITADAVDSLELKAGDSVIALIKTNEVMLAK